MAKVGILHYAQAKDRCGARGAGDLFGLGLPKMTIGFNRIVCDAAKNHDVKYVDIRDTWAEYWLASVVSWYDVYNLVRSLRGVKSKAKLIVGGPGIINPWPLADILWAACIGRGEGLVCRIIDGDLSLPNVWYRDSPGRELSVGQATDRVCSARESEGFLGCKLKCYFCEYGWRYKPVDWEGQYSEYSNRETFLRDVNFEQGRATAGLDGLTERERYIVNKPLSNGELLDILQRHRVRNNFLLKLYSIVGYPFTDRYDLSEFDELMRRAAKVVKRPMTIMLSLSHFCPMPLTPMEEERVVYCERVQRAPEKIGNIKWGTYLQGTGYSSAAYEALIFRARTGDNIVPFILSHTHSKETAWKIAEAFPHVIDGGYVPVPLVRRTYPTNSAKREYRARVSRFATPSHSAASPPRQHVNFVPLRAQQGKKTHEKRFF